MVDIIIKNCAQDSSHAYNSSGNGDYSQISVEEDGNMRILFTGKLYSETEYTKKRKMQRGE